MATAYTSLSYHNIVNDFNDVLATLTLKAFCGRDFIRVERLKEWLQNTRLSPIDGQPRRQIDLLAHVAYGDRLWNSIYPAIEPSTLMNDCPLTFCILVELQHGHEVNEFHRHHLTDLNLRTMDSSQLRATIENNMKIKDAASLAKSFDELRWKYFVPEFDLRQAENYSKNCILPITKRIEIKTGGTAKLYRIEVLEEFVGEKLRKEGCNCVEADTDELGKVCMRLFNRQ